MKVVVVRMKLSESNEFAIGNDIFVRKWSGMLLRLLRMA
jgi:hypothetical protein